VVISEGRNREVRKLFDAVGHAVSRLIRIRYGSVVLPRGLRRGVWVDLSPEDVQALRDATGMNRGQARGGPQRARADKRGGRRGRRDERGERGTVGTVRSGRRRPERGDRPDGGFGRPPRAHGQPAGFQAPDFDREDAEGDAIGPIPNPLQQTYDRRAIQQARKQREYAEDGPIPNPLQQTYDKRALQADQRAPVRDLDEDGPIPNPLQQTYDRRFAQPGRPGGPRPGAGKPCGPRRKAGPEQGGPRQGGQAGQGGARGEQQPDPMRTSVGYIGADAFLNKGKGGKGGRRGGGGSGGGGGGRRPALS
jgi:23S rRNA pseudouridine2605 synthase